MQPQTFLPLIFLFEGALLALVAVPLVRGRIPRNPLYGFRTPRTLASDAVWYPANRYAGQELLRAGVAIGIGSLALLAFAGRLSVDMVGGLGLVLTLAPLGVAVVRSFRYLSRLP